MSKEVIIKDVASLAVLAVGIAIVLFVSNWGYLFAAAGLVYIFFTTQDYLRGRDPSTLGDPYVLTSERTSFTTRDLIAGILEDVYADDLEGVDEPFQKAYITGHVTVRCTDSSFRLLFEETEVLHVITLHSDYYFIVDGKNVVKARIVEPRGRGQMIYTEERQRFPPL